MTQALWIFLCAATVVFAVGLQIRHVTNHCYAGAAGSALTIAAANLVLFKLLPGSDLLGVAAFLAANPVGIVLSMVAHGPAGKPD